MEHNNTATLMGKVSVNKSGKKTFNVWGGQVFAGWGVKVTEDIVDSKGQDREVYVTYLNVKTTDANVADKLASVEDNKATLIGYLKSENISRDEKNPNFVQFFYVSDVK
jgi:hypothetical protein